MAEHQNFRTALAGFNREDVVRYIEYLNTTHAAEIAQLNSELEYLRSQLREPPEEETSEAPAPDNILNVGEQVVQVRDLLDSWKQSSNFQDALQAAADSLKSETSENAEELEQLKTDVEEKTAEIELLKADVEAKDTEIQVLKAEVEEKASEIRDLKAAAEAKDAELQSLNSQNEALRSQQEANDSLMEKELETYRRAERVERKARERADLVYYRVNGTLTDATGKVEDAARLIGEMTQRVTAQLSELQEAVAGSKSALSDAVDTMVALRPEPEE